jgi:hypothetical protein
MLKASRSHLVECGESYAAHCGAALRISWTLAGAALACAVHAFVPGLFTRTASSRVEEVRDGILARRAASGISSDPLYAARIETGYQP